MAAEQILHIMLRGDEQNIEAQFVHQPVEPRGVKGRGAWFFGDVEQGFLRGSCAGPPWRALAG